MISIFPIIWSFLPFAGPTHILKKIYNDQFVTFSVTVNRDRQTNEHTQKHKLLVEVIIKKNWKKLDLTTSLQRSLILINCYCRFQFLLKVVSAILLKASLISGVLSIYPNVCFLYIGFSYLKFSSSKRTSVAFCGWTCSCLILMATFCALPSFSNDAL